MNKIAQQFQNDVVTRYQQKMAGLMKLATPVENQASMTVPVDAGGAEIGFDPNKDYGHLKADDMQVPETTWFENLANSAPVSALLDAAEATGVDRWADDINNSLAGSIAGDIGTNIGDWVGDLERGSEGDIAQAMDIVRDNKDTLALYDSAMKSYQDAVRKNPLGDYSFVPNVPKGEIGLRRNKLVPESLVWRDFLLGEDLRKRDNLNRFLVGNKPNGFEMMSFAPMSPKLM